jgi:hypothetical protein
MPKDGSHAVELDVEGARELYQMAAAAGGDVEQANWKMMSSLQQQGPQNTVDSAFTPKKTRTPDLGAPEGFLQV